MSETQAAWNWELEVYFQVFMGFLPAHTLYGPDVNTGAGGGFHIFSFTYNNFH